MMWLKWMQILTDLREEREGKIEGSTVRGMMAVLSLRGQRWESAMGEVDACSHPASNRHSIHPLIDRQSCMTHLNKQ